jgi:hypothetical protein
MLQVRVHRDQGIPAGRRQAGQEKRLMTKVPGEACVMDPKVLALQILEHGQGAVGASVIHDDQFERPLIGKGGRDVLVKLGAG